MKTSSVFRAGKDDGEKDPKGVPPGSNWSETENEPPAADNDSYTVVHDRMLEVAAPGVLDNDTDPEEDPLTAYLVTEPTNGSVTSQIDRFNADGSFSYLPKPGFVGTDSFTYKVTDGTNTSNTATVTITVTNSTPTAGADNYTTPQDQRLVRNPPGPVGGTAGVLVNDSDGDSDPLRSLLVSDVSHGSLVLRDDGSFVYTPEPNYFGTDSFTYEVTDGVATKGPVTATIQIARRTGPDLDGHDPATTKPWMPESDELTYGLGVSIHSSATIRLWEPLPPESGSILLSRRLSWHPNVLLINGDPDGWWPDIPLSGVIDCTVDAQVAGYGLIEPITYFETWQLPSGDMLIANALLLAVEEKSTLETLQFTNDHDVIYENTVDVFDHSQTTRPIQRYKAIEFNRATGYNAPVTITRSLNDKIKVKLVINHAGIAQGTQFSLTGTCDVQQLIFSSAVFPLPEGNAFEIELTATNWIGFDIAKHEGTITWRMVLRPGTPQSKTLDLGTSGKHRVYSLLDKPKLTRWAFVPTDKRLDIAVGRAATAMTAAFQYVTDPFMVPTWPRFVMEMVRLNVFNLKNGVLTNTRFLATQDGEKNLSGAWEAYELQTRAVNPGVDCLSCAAFTWCLLEVIATPGTISADAYMAKSAAEPHVAVVYDELTAATTTIAGVNYGLRYFFEDDNTPNRFEGALKYTPPGSTVTYYYPIMNDSDQVYGSQNDVLTVFDRANWYNGVMRLEHMPNNPVHRYVEVDSVDIDN